MIREFGRNSQDGYPSTTGTSEYVPYTTHPCGGFQMFSGVFLAWIINDSPTNWSTDQMSDVFSFLAARTNCTSM
eukprot:TRINITY_DN4235_c0_g1_i1.p2 TRINITY_DN4235_c0_g1~~TRINITY_DN4235_c0_g1_i1.p2  ORF type:complete len:74 (-),score=4.82 TRINITY_DN4235_c0_g1_i1:256-477(-)